MEALEVGHLGRVARLDERLEAGVDERGHAAAEHGLLAEEVRLRLVLERGLDDAGARAADAPSVGQRHVLGLARRILVHADEAGHARPFGEHAAHHVARALRRDHDHVHVRGRGDAAVMDVEAVREREGVAGLEVRGDLGLVGGGLGLVGREDHDEVGFLGGLGHAHDLEAGLLGGLARLRALAQAHAHVGARVLQVERMGVALAPVADDGHLLALDELGVRIVLVVDRDSHGVGFLSVGWF